MPRHLGTIAASVVALATIGFVGPALADGFGASQATLTPVPHDMTASGHSDVHAQATLVRTGDFVLARVRVTGAAPGLVHAQHIHGVGMHACPTAAADANGDGLVSTLEGAPAYGPVVVTLTTSGDTSPASALAVDRLPVADRHGTYTYVRKLRIGSEIPTAVADHLDEFHVVVHGIDTNHDGTYDFSKGPSDLNPALPEEATVPAACGLIR